MILSWDGGGGGCQNEDEYENKDWDKKIGEQEETVIKYNSHDDLIIIW